MLVAPSTTWALVTIRPSLETTKPLPVAVPDWRLGGANGLPEPVSCVTSAVMKATEPAVCL